MTTLSQSLVKLHAEIVIPTDSHQPCKSTHGNMTQKGSTTRQFNDRSSYPSVPMYHRFQMENTNTKIIMARSQINRILIKKFAHTLMLYFARSRKGKEKKQTKVGNHTRQKKQKRGIVTLRPPPFPNKTSRPAFQPIHYFRIKVNTV